MARKSKRLKNLEDKTKEEPSFVEATEPEARKPLKKLEIIKQWTYLLDEETGFFKYPDLPELDDCVINKFVNDKSTRSCQIYTCPYCKRIFTYSLCFKTHLYTCQKSPHCEHLYLCSWQGCAFSSIKKQIIIQHYTMTHLGTASKADAGRHSTDSKDPSILKARFNKANYSYVNGLDYQFAFDFYKHCNMTYTGLDIVDFHLRSQEYSKFM
jgi:hypothetical protein